MGPAIGDVVVYTDQHGRKHNALVCQNWGGDAPSLNLVYVSDDETKTDQYGRQIQREATSVVPRGNQAAPGRFWEPFVVGASAESTA